MNYILRSGAMIALTVSGLLFATAANAQTITGESEAYSAPMGTTVVVGAPGVLENELLRGGYDSKQALTATLDSAPQFGTVVVDSDGGFTYTPTEKSINDSFTYICSDGLGNTATSTAFIVFDDVIAGDDEFKVVAGIAGFCCAPGILANDTGPASGITAVLAIPAQFGRLELQADGSFSYAMFDNVTAESDHFAYFAVDWAGNASMATVRIFFVPADEADGEKILSISGGTPGSDAGGDVGNEGGSCSASEGVSPWLLLACLALLVSALRMRRAGA